MADIYNKYDEIFDIKSNRIGYSKKKTFYCFMLNEDILEYHKFFELQIKQKKKNCKR